MAQEQIDLVHIGVDGLFGNNRARLIGLAARYRVPTSYPWREFTAEGGLMNYGADIREHSTRWDPMRREYCAARIPPICRCGGRPSSPSRSTSRPHSSLGIEPSPMLLSLADEVIESDAASSSSCSAARQRGRSRHARSRRPCRWLVF